MTASSALRLVCLLAGGLLSAQPAAQKPAGPEPIDPQRVQDQDTMTWDDYRPIPGTKWADPATKPAQRAFRVALVAVDFEDQPFVVTLPKHSDPFGNPQIDPIQRPDVARFYADFWGKPGPLNHGHTIHEYWMEQSRGRVGMASIDAYGPYRMPRKLFQYGLNEHKQAVGCPTDYTCNHRMEPDVDALWMQSAGADVKQKYDIVLRIYAGYDETTVWQEFGEMKFASKEDIPAEWGNPDPTKPRWVPTRYVPWTSWLAGAQQWGLSSVRQGESSGTITHEIAHFAFQTGDNNNNPYATPYRRVGSGPWDIMDRGSFNGPGGPHKRWVVPAAAGASMPAGFMLRNRLRYGWLRTDQVLMLTRSGLAESGVTVATVTARAVEPHPGELAGIVVSLDGEAPRDRTPKCDISLDPLCAGEPIFDFYSIEVVQRIGYDSFTPDNGVLIAKNKQVESRSCGYNCFTWVIDAHPENIKVADYKKPDGTVVMRTPADYRQLNDALFHAGLRSGSQFEWKDEANRLHFYVVDLKRSATGVISYTVAVRSLDAPASQRRGLQLEVDKAATVGGGGQSVNVIIRNTGVGTDLYRVSATIEGAGWDATLGNALVAVQGGQTATVPVRVTRPATASRPVALTFTAVSESDATKRATATTRMTAAR